MTKEELKECYNKRCELRQIDMKIKRLQEDARSPSGVRYSDAPRGRGEAVPAMQRYVERLDELSQIYEEKRSNLMKDIIRIERAITALPPELRMLMRYRYIDGMKWEEVNQQMGKVYGKDIISERTSKRLHCEALRYLQNI